MTTIKNLEYAVIPPYYCPECGEPTGNIIGTCTSCIESSLMDILITENNMTSEDDYFSEIMRQLMEGEPQTGVEMFKAMPKGYRSDFCCGIHEDDVDMIIAAYKLVELI
jgi:hypothetical protein